VAVDTQKIEEYKLEKEPYYLPLKNEVELFEAAYKARLPVMLKGPTGCGKTRFVEHMSWRLKRTLVTVACHEDLTASDLVGKYTLSGDETVWQDGPLTTAVKAGGIAYLDEIVEARKDTTVVIHPLTDDRRVLPIEKKGEIVKAPDDFLLVISYKGLMMTSHPAWSKWPRRCGTCARTVLRRVCQHGSWFTPDR